MNNITIELCAEDRARLDRLTEALERKACGECATPEVKPTAEAPTVDTEETTVQEEIQTVDRTQLRTKVIELSAKGMKEQAKQIVQDYAPTVASVPEDMISECYVRLIALEG